MRCSYGFIGKISCIVLPSLIILSLLAPCVSWGQSGNPFTSQENEQGEEASNKVGHVIDFPSIVQRFINRMADIQRGLNKRIAELGRQMREGSKSKTTLIITTIAFIYGVVHSLGPGHGKLVAFSYFLTENRVSTHGIWFGVLVGFTQVAMALIVVYAIYFSFQQAFMSSIESFSRIIKRVSSISIAGLGIWLLLQSLGIVRHIHIGRPIDEKRTANHSHNNRFWPIALSVGIIPCPGAVILILFSLNMGIPKTGVLLAMVMALGMTVTISVVSIVTVTAKDLLSSTLSGKRTHKLFQTGLQTLGAIFILTIGTIIFLGTV